MYVLLVVVGVVVIGFSFALEISCLLVFYENMRDKPRMKYPSVVFCSFVVFLVSSVVGWLVCL
jgi:hypothetical protein